MYAKYVLVRSASIGSKRDSDASMDCATLETGESTASIVAPFNGVKIHGLQVGRVQITVHEIDGHSSGLIKSGYRDPR